MVNSIFHFNRSDIQSRYACILLHVLTRAQCLGTASMLCGRQTRWPGGLWGQPYQALTLSLG